MELKEQIRITLKQFINERKRLSDEEIRLLLKKYETLKDLFTNNQSLYNVIKRRGDDYFKEMTKDLKRAGLSKDDVRNIARKYNTLSDFMKNDNKAYTKAKRFGQDFYQEVTAHMMRKRNALLPYQRRLSDNDIWEIAKRYSTINDFKKNHPKEYRDAVNIGRDFIKNITSHMEVPFRTKVMSQDEIRSIIKKYNTLKDFAENETKAYRDFRKYGNDFRREVTNHFVSPDEKTFSADENTFSVDELSQIASKYDNERDFLRGDKEAYKSALKLGRQFFNDITNHMKYPESFDINFESKKNTMNKNFLTEVNQIRKMMGLINEQENEVTPEMIISMLMKEAESTPQENYDDVYDWMQDVFSPVESDLEDMGVDIDNLRMLYDDIIMDLWEGNDDDEF